MEAVILGGGEALDDGGVNCLQGDKAPLHGAPAGAAWTEDSMPGILSMTIRQGVNLGREEKGAGHNSKASGEGIT